jgi:hypothetical protein
MTPTATPSPSLTPTGNPAIMALQAQAPGLDFRAKPHATLKGFRYHLQTRHIKGGPWRSITKKPMLAVEVLALWEATTKKPQSIETPTGRNPTQPAMQRIPAT